jgi:hypothetical protein
MIYNKGAVQFIKILNELDNFTFNVVQYDMKRITEAVEAVKTKSKVPVTITWGYQLRGATYELTWGKIKHSSYRLEDIITLYLTLKIKDINQRYTISEFLNYQHYESI